MSVPVDEATPMCRSLHHQASTLLIGFRALIGPWLLFDASDGRVSPWFIWVFAAGVLSDVVDGELLRRQHLSDPQSRSLDSSADAVFYISVFVSMWFVHSERVRALMPFMTVLLATQLASWVFCLAKFGRTTSYHSYVAKCWGLTLFIGTIAFFTPANEVLVMLLLAVGVASHIEDMCMTAILPIWKTDVLSVRAARMARWSMERRQMVRLREAVELVR